MKTNKRSLPIHTAEGAVALRINPELALRRSVMVSGRTLMVGPKRLCLIFKK